MILQHKFVEFIPDVLEEGVLYVSIEFCTVIHKCVCGCQNEVVTPLSPNDWKIIFNGKTLSLSPSVNNLNFQCQSHYFITDNEIIFARKWEEPKITHSKKIDFGKKVKSLFKRKKRK